MKHIEKEIDFKQLVVSSTAFKYGESIPVRYTCDGLNISPAIDINGIPESAVCLALVFDDPDAPIGTWVHWLVWNIPVTHHIKENRINGIQGINDFQQIQYSGPCPHSGKHRYILKIYGLNALLNLPKGSKVFQLEKAMSEHIIAYGEMMGYYERLK